MNNQEKVALYERLHARMFPILRKILQLLLGTFCCSDEKRQNHAMLIVRVMKGNTMTTNSQIANYTKCERF